MQLQLRTFVYCAIVLVMLLGLIVAASNLPVLTHCEYYGECAPAANLAEEQLISTDPVGI